MTEKQIQNSCLHITSKRQVNEKPAKFNLVYFRFLIFRYKLIKYYLNHIVIFSL